MIKMVIKRDKVFVAIKKVSTFASAFGNHGSVNIKNIPGVKIGL